MNHLRIVPGATEDFSSFVAARRPALLRVARSITGDAHAAEDLVQSALVSVLPRWGGLRERRAADAYVHRAMVNQHTSWHRQPWRHRERCVDELPEPVSAEPAAHDDDLWPLVRALPAQQRAAVVLRYYEGLSVADTAQVLGCTTGTVKSNTSRGLAALRRLVDPDHADEPAATQAS